MINQGLDREARLKPKLKEIEVKLVATRAWRVARR